MPRYYRCRDSAGGRDALVSSTDPVGSSNGAVSMLLLLLLL